MTKTQQNRTSISIMNLWVNRIGRLALFAVALFFFSCEDETSTLGYKNPNSKFKVSYVEIPIESSVLLRDSLRTTNFTYTGEPSRFLVGSYTDPVFGKISAAALTQYFARNPQFKVSATAVYDSATLELQFDLYHYGSMTASPQTISVYELDDSLQISTAKYYFNNSEVAHSTVIGSKGFTVDPVKFDEFAASAEDSDTVITVSMPLASDFGKRIFDANVRYRDDVDKTFGTYWKFIQEFKGIAVESDVADKVLGLNPLGFSRIIVHYHDATADSLIFDMTFSGDIGFSQIKSDRTGTALEPLQQYYTDVLQDNDKRYIQSGIGILTKLDFSNFYKFTDTVPYAVINSAELAIESVESSSDYPPPSLLSLRVLDESTNRMNRFSLSDPQDVEDLLGYNQLLRRDNLALSGSVLVDNDDVFYAADRSPALVYSSKENKYSMVVSLFLQQLVAPLSQKTKFKTFVLHPAVLTGTVPTESGLKTVNRAVFPKDKIKLKIFYTKPTATQ
ncbi:MAG TPA: DUF4270 family protein [Chryseolinea sp.]|nr:DUF4270 family protein [Chryseolinea sp.]